MIVISILGIIGLLVFAIYYCISSYISIKNSGNEPNAEFRLEFNYYFSLSITWLIIGIIAAIVLLIILLLIIFLIKRLRLAIQLIREASKAVVSLFITLIFPIIPLLIQLGFLAYFLITAVILASSGKNIYKVANSTNSSIKIGDTCDINNLMNGVTCTFYTFGFDSTSMVNSVIDFLYNNQWLPQLFNFFMFLWFESFIVGFNQMVLAGKIE